MLDIGVMGVSWMVYVSQLFVYMCVCMYVSMSVYMSVEHSPYSPSISKSTTTPIHHYTHLLCLCYRGGRLQCQVSARYICLFVCMCVCVYVCVYACIYRLREHTCYSSSLVLVHFVALTSHSWSCSIIHLMVGMRDWTLGCSV